MTDLTGSTILRVIGVRIVHVSVILVAKYNIVTDLYVLCKETFILNLPIGGAAYSCNWGGGLHVVQEQALGIGHKIKPSDVYSTPYP